jgi:hypothetical protein
MYEHFVDLFKCSILSPTINVRDVRGDDRDREIGGSHSVVPQNQGKRGLK